MENMKVPFAVFQLVDKQIVTLVVSDGFCNLPMFLEQFNKDSVMRDIAENGMFQLHHRIMVDGEPKPIVLRVAKVEEESGMKLVAGVTIINE